MICPILEAIDILNEAKEAFGTGCRNSGVHLEESDNRFYDLSARLFMIERKGYPRDLAWGIGSLLGKMHKCTGVRSLTDILGNDAFPRQVRA